MLDINNLQVIFNKNTVNEKIALDNFSLHLDDGDFLTVIGNNGAGKTTLLNAIFGLVDINSGSIILDGKDITHLKTHKKAKNIGIVFQNPLAGTAPDMSVLENLVLASSKVSHKPFSIAITKKKEKLIKEEIATLGLGLENKLKTPVGKLSGGERQAITLLMATSNNPNLLLLDEHTAALDPIAANLVINKTEEIVTNNHITTIMITHSIDMALKYGNKLLLLENGKIKKLIDKEEKDKLKVNDILSMYNNNLNDNIILGG